METIWAFIKSNSATLGAMALLAAILSLWFFLPQSKKPKKSHLEDEGQKPDSVEETEEEEEEEDASIPLALRGELGALSVAGADMDIQIENWKRLRIDTITQLKAEGGGAAKAAAFLAKDDFTEAGATLDWIIKSDLQRIADHYFLGGRIKELALDLPGALAFYREAYRLMPDNFIYSTSLGSLLNRVGQHEEALALIKIALPKMRQLADLNPEAYLRDLAEGLAAIGQNHYEQNRFKEGEIHLIEALRCYEKLAKTDAARYLPLVAATMTVIGMLYRSGQFHELARKAFENALLARENTEVTTGIPQAGEISSLKNNLGWVLVEEGKYEEAEKNFRESLEIRTLLAESAPELHLPNLAATYNNLANLFKATGRGPEAEGYYAKALELYNRLAVTNVEAYLPHVAITFNNLGVMYKEAGRYEDAAIAFVAAFERYKSPGLADKKELRPGLAATLNNLGNVHAAIGEFPEANASYSGALRIRRELAKEKPSEYLHEVAATQNNLGALFVLTGEGDEALKSYNEALSIYKKYAAVSPEIFNRYVELVEKNIGMLKDAGALTDDTSRQESGQSGGG